MKKLKWPLLLGLVAFGFYKFGPDIRRELKIYSM